MLPYLPFFKSKIELLFRYWYPGLQKGRPSYTRSLSSEKRTSSTSNMQIHNFFLFLCVICTFLDPDPDPLTWLNPYPIGNRIRNHCSGVSFHLSWRVQWTRDRHPDILRVGRNATGRVQVFNKTVGRHFLAILPGECLFKTSFEDQWHFGTDPYHWTKN